MHTVDCNTLLERNTPDALVLAILCDFKGRPAEAVVREIGTRLRLLLHNDDKGFLDYFSMLEILGQNRDLEQQLKETKTMLTQIDVSRLPSYQWGREDTLKELEAIMARKIPYSGRLCRRSKTPCRRNSTPCGKKRSKPLG
jgi:hypothetical protein